MPGDPSDLQVTLARGQGQPEFGPNTGAHWSPQPSWLSAQGAGGAPQDRVGEPGGSGTGIRRGTGWPGVRWIPAPMWQVLRAHARAGGHAAGTRAHTRGRHPRSHPRSGVHSRKSPGSEA